MSRRAWVAGAQEARWHACRVSDAGGSLVVACGHRLYGPVHRRINVSPPHDGREVCQVCAKLVNWLPPLRRNGEVLLWPSDNSDEPSDTGRLRVLSAALEVARPEMVPAGPHRADTTSRRSTGVLRVA